MKKINSKLMAVDIAEIALFVALMCIFTLFVSIPAYPVPITFQTVISVLAGLLMGWKKGAIAMAVYCVMGLIGIPVFSNFTGSIAAVVRPTFGYIIGFICSAFVAGIICPTKKLPLWRYIVGALAAFLVNYIIGIPYFALIWRYYLNRSGIWQYILDYNVLYMPKDFVLCLIAAVVAWRVVPIIYHGRKKLNDTASQKSDGGNQSDADANQSTDTTNQHSCAINQNVDESIQNSDNCNQS